jgi:cytochrome P450
MDYFFHAGFIDRTDNPARAELDSYVRDLIAYKRKHPGADITTDLLAKQAAGEVHSGDELIAMMYVLLGVGYLSTVPVLSTAVLRLLLQNPGQVAAHSAEPGFWSAVAEEVLRYDSAVQTSHIRIALDDVMIGDVLVRKGDTVTVSLAGANRDPEQFADPEAFDTRRPLRSHLAFGHGVHLCVGAHLARLEVQIALHTLFRRVSTLRLEPPPGGFTWVLGPVLRSVRKVPVTFEPN